MRRLPLAALCAAFALGPLLYVVALGSQVDLAHEFVFGRIGAALALLHGEAQYVRTEQALPTALLSKLVVAVTPDVVSPEGLRRYSVLWTAGLLAPLAAFMVFAWARLPVSHAITQSLMLGLPWWFGTAALGLMIAPEYWQGEWAYLGMTFAIIAAIRCFGPPQHAHLLAGLWAGLGATLKITMLPVVFLLLYFIGRNTRRNVALCFASFAAAYVGIAFLYMGGIKDGMDLLEHQARFFVTPNNSAIYSDWRATLKAHPPVIVLALASIIVLRTRAGLILAAWSLLFAYLLYKRPHDSSLTSFGLFLGFALAVGILQLQRFRILVLVSVTSAFIAFSYWNDSFLTVRRWHGLPSVRTPASEQAAADAFFSKAPTTYWFIPDNNWNATYGPQGIGYNGSIGLRPLHIKPVAFHSLFSNTFIIGPSEAELNIVPANEAAVMYWTRPVGSDPSILFNALKSLTIDERPGRYRGRAWIFGKATHHP